MATPQQQPIQHQYMQQQPLQQQPLQQQQFQQQPVQQQYMQQQPMQQQYMQQTPPSQQFAAVPLQNLKVFPAPVDCPNCGRRERTITATKLTPMDCGELTKVLFIGFCGVPTVRRKWVEHTCPVCSALLVRHYPALQPSTHGRVRLDMQPEGETEVVAFARG